MTEEQETTKETPEQRVKALILREMSACTREALLAQEKTTMLEIDSRAMAVVETLPGYAPNDGDAMREVIVRRWTAEYAETRAWCNEVAAIWAHLLTCVMMRHREDTT